ncbi:hypothetical protein L873DRAFT_1941074, partial [Choiromyces venosus 120613-1]
MIQVLLNYSSCISSLSQKLNNLFYFTLLSVTSGLKQLPSPSNITILGQVYHQ